MSDLTEAREAVLVAADKRSTALLDAIDALLSEYRSALAGETDVVEAAAKAMMRDEFSYLPPEAVPEDGAIDMEVYRGYARAAAPILRAPLLVQLQDKEERIKGLEIDLAKFIELAQQMAGIIDRYAALEAP